ncbi:MAG: pyruvate ferredoxin oxidoreductase [Parcubacteria group bacterium CG_4_9_14_0_2_um_filter_35_11]|nr:MAG: pyruvate ferredoxin oxidoreductase [Parcubacteria group bacterium CG07_land_8_20_14_0_80_35_11]PJC47573.1 MAG: pyruvate ferredoxin oxidoreductase [Parcubacteria group bacterium CG_4_9_14_0_2_um_filter_35_11]
MKKDYSILIGGAAGEGSRVAGLLGAKLLNKLGYRIFIYDDYQSLIRGGHNFSKIRASEKKILSQRRGIDFLLALNKDTIERHKDNLGKKGIIIYNSDKMKDRGIGIPIEKITKEEGGIPIMKNVALLGGFAKVIGMDWKIAEEVFKKELTKKTDLNLKIAKRAYRETKNLIKIEKLDQEPLSLLTGNEAISLGAVKAGLNLYLAYPMTPASSILHYLAAHQEEFNIAVSHPENEIAVINMALGAAYAGARTMVGTSGGGFALMTEALSMAAQSETPILIVESQRTAPSSGVPTYTGQGDLFFVMGAGHGDFLRFVIAPGDAEEAFYLTGEALNLAWKYQTPAILLVDKEVSENTFSVDKDIEKKVRPENFLARNKKGNYKRYKDTKEGISPLAFPGQKNIISKATSYEHDEFGISTEEEKDIEKMQNKRLRKFKKMAQEVEKLEAVKTYGKKNSQKAIVVWGSTKGPALEAAEKLGIKMIQPIFFQPFPEKQMRKALKGVKKLISIEGNSLGQMEQVLRCYGIKPDNRILKYTGRPFLPEEIEERVKKII